MRAPANEATGTSGQSFVKGQFEALGWGVSPNTEHDLGTDHWLEARDARRFDLGALVGAQVKSGESYFREPEFEGDLITGWWYREADASHFEYWVDHNVPHILVLHDEDTRLSYWVHITPERVVSTGQGRKILVPADSTVDADHLGDLRSVALAQTPVPEWEGSAWSPGESIPTSSRLRYALLTPRLVAPHPNNKPQAIDAPEAIAMLVRGRLGDLERWDDVEPRLTDATVAAASGWDWRLFAALRRLIFEGDSDQFQAVVESAPSPEARAAAAVVAGHALFEDGRVEAALGLADGALAPDDLNPVDHAWLAAHKARYLVELGDLSTALELFIEVQAVSRVASKDPTARMIAGAAAEMIFQLGNWDSQSLADAIQGQDNVGSWWRAQTLVSGLSKQLDEAFRSWGNDTSVTFGAEDTGWTQLRSAMLIAGLASDTPAWRNAASYLARRQLMVADDEDSRAWALDLLRLSGNHKALELAVGRMLEYEPVAPLVRVVTELDLDTSTRTSLQANILLIGRAADVLTSEAADRHARWAMRTLAELPRLADRLHPTFLLEQEVVNLLAAVEIASSPDVQAEVRQFVTDLPPVKDQLVAGRYARLLAGIEHEAWSESQLDALAHRGANDHDELRQAIERVRSQRDPAVRASLLAAISAGDLSALASWGKVTDLPDEAVVGMMTAMSRSVQQQREAATGGTYGFGGPDLLRTLVLLSAWHPDHACWTFIVNTLADPAMAPVHIKGAIELIGNVTNQIPPEFVENLRPILSELSGREPKMGPLDVLGDRTDIRGVAATALAQLHPETVTPSAMQERLTGSPSQRAAAINIIVRSKDESSLTLLAALAMDTEVEVRAAVARGLALWVADGIAVPGSIDLLDRLLGEPGLRLGVYVSGGIGSGQDEAGETILLGRLKAHPSALVRARVAARQSEISATAD